MSEIVATSTAQRRFQTLLLTTFAGIAMLLAALGIYGTLSYSVNQRYREIGIRLALGAQGRDVGTLVLRQALTPVVLGLAAGCVGALFLMRTLSALLYLEMPPPIPSPVRSSLLLRWLRVGFPRCGPCG